ncbi:MAG: amino acid--tRNA ligase-related protein, partial [Pseudomonadota bacterium]
PENQQTGGSREDYLRDWEPFPTLNLRAQPGEGLRSVSGRVVSLDSESFQLQSEGQIFNFSSSLQDCQVLSGPKSVWQVSARPRVAGDLLQEGDWIRAEFGPESRYLCQLLLLAPNLRSDYPVAKTTDLPISWTEFLSKIRQHFVENSYREVITPTLVRCPGLEAHLKPFRTTWTESSDENRNWYLPTSPELHLKKLLCRGEARVFEIKKVFRDDLKSPLHRPEFHMLEWYMAMADLDDLLEVLKHLMVSLGFKESDWRETTVQELFDRHCGLRLRADTTREELQLFGEELKLDMAADESFDDLFQKMWVGKIEPALEDTDGPIVIRDFPPGQAALAKL